MFGTLQEKTWRTTWLFTLRAALHCCCRVLYAIDFLMGFMFAANLILQLHTPVRVSAMFYQVLVRNGPGIAHLYRTKVRRQTATVTKDWRAAHRRSLPTQLTTLAAAAGGHLWTSIQSCQDTPSYANNCPDPTCKHCVELLE